MRRRVVTAKSIADRRWALSYMWAFRGVPYKIGGDDPIGGWDCTGMISEYLRVLNLMRRRERGNTKSLWADYKNMEVPLEEAIAGDLLFISRTEGFLLPHDPFHAEIYMGSGWCYGASGGDEDTDTEAEAAQLNAFTCLRKLSRFQPPRYYVRSVAVPV